MYGGPLQTVSFDTICNLYDASSIVDCYEGDATNPIPEIKDENGEWNTVGHPDRLLHITRKELAVFAQLFDGGDNWKGARLPVLHVKEIVDFLRCISNQERRLGDYQNEISVTQMWDETNAQKNNLILRSVHFPGDTYDLIYSGPHIFVGNPLFKTSRRECRLNSDYDNIDLTNIGSHYYQRVNYTPQTDLNSYVLQIPDAGWGAKCNDTYRVLFRRMLNLGGERTLIGAIVPPHTGHVSTMISVTFMDKRKMLLFAGLSMSLPYDAFVKVLGKGDMYLDTIIRLPFFKHYDFSIILRALMLNCLTDAYKDLWEDSWDDSYNLDSWAKEDERLPKRDFTSLEKVWNQNIIPRNDYARRQLLVELDVLSAQRMGLSLEQLKVVYRILFPIMRQYENETWYDRNGRISFTTNRSLTGVGFSRSEWENKNAVVPNSRGDSEWDGIMKNAPAGYVFTRTIMDDTMPGGPVERTIEYVAPFDRCDREQDYEIAWKFFEEKYSKQE